MTISSKETLRDRLESVLFDVWHDTVEEQATAILAMPEMQALNGAVFMAMTEPPFVRCRQWCDDFLPDSVRAWVIEPALPCTSPESK